MQLEIDHFNFKELDPFLKHLSKEKIYEMITKYYANEKVKDILSEYNMSITPSKLVKTFPPVYLEAKCEKCESHLLGELQSKTSDKMIRRKDACPHCSHRENSRSCTCHFCKEEAIKLEKEKRDVVNSVFINVDTSLILESDLTSEDRLYLSVLLRAALSEDMNIIVPLDSIKSKLAPTNQLKEEIVKTLIAKEIILVSEHSSLEAFIMQKNEEGKHDISYYTYQVVYKLNVKPFDGNYSSMIERVLYPEPESFNVEFCYEKWRQVALNEIEEYLLYEMNKVGYSFNLGKKSYQVFNQLLNHFSTAQIFNIIFRAVSNSTRRYQAREITKVHAQNSVITSCESQGHRAIAENWTLKPYGRNYDLPESLISEVLFNSIMHISSLGFSEVPTVRFR